MSLDGSSSGLVDDLDEVEVDADVDAIASDDEEDSPSVYDHALPPASGIYGTAAAAAQPFLAIDDIDSGDEEGPAPVALPHGVSAKRIPPAEGPLPPSLTRKRPRGARQIVLAPFDLSVRPSADGRWRCEGCGADYSTRTLLFGHARFCETVSVWQCEWCKCTAAETHHKCAGPNGPKTLCSACAQRFRSGHSSMPQQNERGEWVCERCLRGFPDMRALGGHRRFCDGGAWRCGWCEIKAEETSGKGPGPAGAGTLCSACSQRYRGGSTGPPARDEQGRFLCDHCSRAFETMAGLGSHRSRCDGGVWRCGWCECKREETSGLGP